ncbi:tetratricopeptide repeat protein, partial [Salmonella sp. SAL4435]|uniref:tetratricopeptide repeat protein n=1 Tax=Salmonella sp. SAL4435 TaxID=3159890 RepID=UPI0039788910
MDLKKHRQAQEDFVASGLLDEQNVEAPLGLGRVCIERKEYQKAEISLNRAAELAPDNPEVHQTLGLLY